MSSFVTKQPAPAVAKNETSTSKDQTSTNSYVCCIIDITGSMGNQIEGLKVTVRELIPLIADNPSLGIAIITFTESRKKCYVSVDKFSDPAAADAFVRDIRLSRPPGYPGIAADGDDGDENSKAALHALTELDGTKPTVAFFITDNSYHYSTEATSTARAEEEYLVSKGVQDTDFFVMLDSVLAHFGGNLTVVPIVYNFGRFQDFAMQAYGQVALASGSGVVIEPVCNTPQILSLTMGTFVRRLLGQLNGERNLPPAPPEDMVAGLRMFDTSQMSRVSRQTDPVGPCPTLGDGEKLFESAMIRAATAFKVSWKRCIDVDKVALLRQLVFGLTAAKFVFATTTHSPVVDDLMRRLRESFPKLLEVVPEDQKTHIKATPEVIEMMATDLAVALSDMRGGAGTEETVDVVSLETVRDALEAALEKELKDADGQEAGESEYVDPLESVFGMVHGVLINVRFPAGPDGKPNYADSWSAMIDKHSFDVVSAESALRLFKGSAPDWAVEESSAAIGVTDRRVYNGFVPLMDEKDLLKTAVLRIFSGLQIMNLLQMTVLAGSPGGFLPNMYPGTLAASLARVILTSAGGSWAGEEAAAAEANDLLASKMIFSLRNVMGRPVAAARKRLGDGKADPNNPMAKFLAILCRLPRDSKEDEERFRKKLCLVLDEWVATTVQLYFGKGTLENDEKFHAFIKDILPLEAIFGDGAVDVDPLKSLHPIERFSKKDEKNTCEVVAGWKTAGLARLSKTVLYRDLQRLVDRCRVVFKCADMEYPLDGIVLDFVIYRFRVARYEFVHKGGPPSSPEGSSAKAGTVAVRSGSVSASASPKRANRGIHEPLKEMPSALNCLVEIYSKALHGELASLKETRRVHAADMIRTQVVSTMSLSPESRTTTVLGTTYTLGRMDVPDILEAVGYTDLRFVEELVLGEWTPEPPQCLRRHTVTILAGVTAAWAGEDHGLLERLREAISSQQVCKRLDRCNRHGHTAALRFPGSMGWTEPYAKARTTNLADAGRTPARILPQMRKYTDFGTEVLKRLENNGNAGVPLVVGVAKRMKVDGEQVKAVVGLGGVRGAVNDVLYSYEDANCLPIVREKIARFNVPGLLDGL